MENYAIRVFVFLYSRSSYVSDKTFYLPERTVNYLIGNGKLIGEEKVYWREYTFKLEYLGDNDLATSEIPEKNEETAQINRKDLKSSARPSFRSC